MNDALLIDRLQFTLTVTFHYIFPQLTMGLALLIVIVMICARRTGNPMYADAARFWGRIFAINFAVGVVTGIPMEFQFGTNWSCSRNLRAVLSGKRSRWKACSHFSSNRVFWGCFCSVKNGSDQKCISGSPCWSLSARGYPDFSSLPRYAWMQHPVAYSIGADGSAHLTSFWGLLTNAWAFSEHLYTMAGAVVTASFVMASVGAYYLLSSGTSRTQSAFPASELSWGWLGCSFETSRAGDQQGDDDCQSSAGDDGGDGRAFQRPNKAYRSS